MKIEKEVIGTLLIDTDNKKIWLNTLSGCLLRLNNINFKNIISKVTMIDINKNDAYMVKINKKENEDYETNFLNSIIKLLYRHIKLKNVKDYNLLYKEIENFINNKIEDKNNDF